MVENYAINFLWKNMTGHWIQTWVPLDLTSVAGGKGLKGVTESCPLYGRLLLTTEPGACCAADTI